jgi:hypothetical protein
MFDLTSSPYTHLGENVVREKEYLSAMVAYGAADGGLDMVLFGEVQDS